MSEIAILELDCLQKSIFQEKPRTLFQGITARIEEPSIIAVLGVSGQGKSTLLRILGRLDTADAGTVSYRGRLSSIWRPHAWRMKVSYVAQLSVMLSGSVEDNLRAASFIHIQPFDNQLAVELMGKVGLGSMDWNKQAADLSGGEKQRVALVRSMLLRPEVLLLDEITASLDLHSKIAVQELLMEWQRKEESTIIWVTHDLEQARLTSDRVWFMGEQTLLEQKDTVDFFTSPESEIARQFLQITREEAN
ncbi:ABC transporter ATP-binding protein [Paenibacillus radicis (ex Xue et al. 2023)]|uniref:ATP-binding cassette domain-containing protein n=1 Tax=Paenibacillus radicis (ex Xue et al. 2023) TaxID=2972489 RepID=A0ABT1YMZ0_9BACL|nr:ATP-binding cassette domain-containing protein [Paenibacillus radicis (ex Xue et al. 2023)]MCR8634533.1 ATP-binding cassette domain-containing protein [Paenibacillus radicis (ex Xue et al. 2023)]